MDNRYPVFYDIMEEREMGAYVKEILVIDDEEFISDILSMMFSEMGYSTTSLSDGSQALKLIMEKNYWAVFCDLKMPGIDGLEVYEKAIALRPELKGHFVILTGSVLNGHTKDLIEKKGIQILFKPFNFEDVNRILKEIESHG